MTIFFPDVSEYTPNVDVTPYPIVLARATLSDRVADGSYTAYEQKSAGKVFVAYHWLNHGNLAAQAGWCFQHVGSNVPVMIDAEDEAGNTGYSGPLTIADITGFAAEYRALGGIVSLVYLPFWYWSGAMGGPQSLDQLTAAGLHLVSSNYPATGYTDNGPGWAPYYTGAPAPVQWQYTSTPIDMNAFRGTVDDFRQLVQPKEQDVDDLANITRPDGSAYTGLVNAAYPGAFHWIQHTADLTLWLNAHPGAQAIQVTEAEAAAIWGVALDVALNPPAPVVPVIDPAALKAVLLDPEVLAAQAKAGNDEAARRLQS